MSVRNADVRQPLTDDKKRAILMLAREGVSDPEIADRIGVTRDQANYTRRKYGTAPDVVSFVNWPDVYCKEIRPRHARGESGDLDDPKWARSCDDAFQKAARAALATGGW